MNNEWKELEEVPYLTSKMVIELKRLGIDSYRKLKKTDLKMLFERSSKKHLICVIIHNLHRNGIHSPCENDIEIKNIGLSRKTSNTLGLNGIIFLSQLYYYSQEQISSIRNIGKKSLKEIIEKCDDFGLKIYSIEPIKKEFTEYKIPDEYFGNFYYYGISSVDDFENKTALDLYAVCNENYSVTVALYQKLKGKVTICKWESCFIFEVLRYQKALKLWFFLNIEKIDDLCNFTKRQIISVRGITLDDELQLWSKMNKFGISYYNKSSGNVLDLERIMN